MSLDRRRLHVRQAQPDDELDDTKSEDSDRHIVFDEATAEDAAVKISAFVPRRNKA
jgi:hypothetical protein